MERAMSYKTTDLNLGAFLLARGHKLTGVEKLRDGRRAMFVFATGSEDVEKFFTNEPVGARDFASAMKTLKAALHAL
jgi:hypothetical protein